MHFLILYPYSNSTSMVMGHENKMEHNSFHENIHQHILDVSLETIFLTSFDFCNYNAICSKSKKCSNIFYVGQFECIIKSRRSHLNSQPKFNPFCFLYTISKRSSWVSQNFAIRSIDGQQRLALFCFFQIPYLYLIFYS